MKFLLTELKKLLTLRITAILAVAVAANFLLFWHNQTRARAQYRDRAYLAAQQELLDMEESERQKFAEEHSRMLEACWEWQFYDEKVQSGASNPGKITEEMLRYQQVYESGGYLRYTENLDAERSLYRKLFSRYGHVRD